MAARSQQSPVVTNRCIMGKWVKYVRRNNTTWLMQITWVPTELSLANVRPVCFADDELWVVADLLQETGKETGLSKQNKNKWQLRGDTGAFDRCVHIPGMLISPEIPVTETQKTQHTLNAFALKERPREKCAVIVRNMSGGFSTAEGMLTGKDAGSELKKVILSVKWHQRQC